MVNKKAWLRMNNNSPKPFSQDISPADDAFYGSAKHFVAEWRYFDAMFTNNYSLHIRCRTFSKGKIDLASPFLEIYNSRKLEAKANLRL